ncbi:MAG: hypothetical protein II960_03990, partial [Synergistaceae bacterium]|nr:hypothetical protein [Synergistaceae bacterium]
NWTFVIWGGLHGLAQIFENVFTRKPKNYQPHGLERVLKVLITFTFCMFAWVFFRAQNLNEAIYVFGNMFRGFSVHLGIGIGLMGLCRVIMYVLILILWDYFSLERDVIIRVSSLKKPFLRYVFYFGLVTLLIMLRAINNTEFVYFQF